MNIVINNLSKSFGNKRVLNNFSCTIKENEVTCIMGQSGCGKTTLLNILLGIMKADSGEVEGTDGLKKSAVFQEDRLFDNFTVYQNIKSVCGKDCSRENILKNLKHVHLQDEIDKEVLTLSGGMKRRVAIVRAVMAEGSILVMDEPFKGLDEGTKADVMKYVLDNLCGRTVIITTHDEEEAEALSHNKLIMDTLEK